MFSFVSSNKIIYKEIVVSVCVVVWLCVSFCACGCVVLLVCFRAFCGCFCAFNGVLCVRSCCACSVGLIWRSSGFIVLLLWFMLLCCCCCCCAVRVVYGCRCVAVAVRVRIVNKNEKNAYGSSSRISLRF